MNGDMDELESLVDKSRWGNVEAFGYDYVLATDELLRLVEEFPH